MRWIVILAVVWLLPGCSRSNDDNQKLVVSVKVASAKLAQVQTKVSAPATIFPRQQANLSPRITAHIQKLLARKGDVVKAGQILASLENKDLVAQRDEARAALSDAQANYEKLASGTLPSDVEKARGEMLSAEAALAQAQKNYTRRSELYEQGAIPGQQLLASQTDLTQAKARYDVAKRTLDLLEHKSQAQDMLIAQSQVEESKARLATIDTQLEYAEVRSPFSGTVTEQFMYPGDLAKPDSPIFTVMDLTIAVARAQVPEATIGAVKRGQSCSFSSQDVPGLEAAGHVTVINRAIDPATRTVEVWCEIPNAQKTLPSGAFGQVTITTGTTPKAVVVPVAAIQFAEGTRSGLAYVIDPSSVAHEVKVQTGESFDGWVQVTEGIKAGDRVIIEGGYGLPDGTTVHISEGGS